MDVSRSLIDKFHNSCSGGVHFAIPISCLRTNELDLVQGVLQILQGLSSSLFFWEDSGQRFCVKSGIYVSHLSQTSLHGILNQFTYAATCLQLVDFIVNKIDKRSAKSPSPTLRAFACSVSACLKNLRDIALREEVKINKLDSRTCPTLLGLSNSLSSLCTGAEFLFQIVHGAIPKAYTALDSFVPAAEIAAHILNYLHKKLNEVCLVPGGEEDAYRMLLCIFVESLLPYVESLDSWLFDGILDDPFEEMFFYANKVIAIDEANFWEKSYMPRSIKLEKVDVINASDHSLSVQDKNNMAGADSISITKSEKEKDGKERDFQLCPFFIQDLAKTIISAGKSLQLIRHSPTVSSSDHSIVEDDVRQSIRGLTLSEVFCVSLSALIGSGDHISEYLWQNDQSVSLLGSYSGKQELKKDNESSSAFSLSDKVWSEFLFETLNHKRKTDLVSTHKNALSNLDLNGEDTISDDHELPCVGSFCPENPALTVCMRFLHNNTQVWSTLNVSKNFYLPPLNDKELRETIFSDVLGQGLAIKGTDYIAGLHSSESEYLRLQKETKMVEILFPFPTLLPTYEEDIRMSEILPFQKNSTLPSRILNWIKSVEPKTNELPVIVLHECLLIYIKKQAEFVGRNILSKLLNDWKLLDELGILRAIYLLGSGDLLQHFLAVTFNKLDKGESLDDDFELNILLQESIRNSADGILLSQPDSLVVSIAKPLGSTHEEEHDASVLIPTPRRNRGQSAGLDGLDALKFTYKVPWPLELIANSEATKKYNQVMGFLLKVKRAKYVLDKARRWMWKDRGSATTNRKRHWLLEQKLLHFVDAFHQYVMDRVYHSAWRELCEGVAAARSLDEVIEAHEAYLFSIQRQCFIVPDKLGALIASRINNILGLALDFYSVQQTLSSGGAVSALKIRCEMEVDRIEKQLDDCITFLLRILSLKLNVGHFPHLTDLVTRINYNNFYMSDGGSLRVVTGSGTVTSKVVKPFQIRTDT